MTDTIKAPTVSSSGWVPPLKCYLCGKFMNVNSPVSYYGVSEGCYNDPPEPPEYYPVHPECLKKHGGEIT